MPSEIIQTRDELGRFGKKARRFSCDQCQLLRINGIVCHETGCINEWMDALRKCSECGGSFEPKERDQGFCSTCCAASATGTKCDCESCNPECDGSHPGPACGYDCPKFCAGRGGGGKDCGCHGCSSEEE